jgi:phospholipase/carboxylesterase
LIEKLIAQEKERGIAPHRIMLAGFSQGGAIALHAGLRHTEELAGIIVLSSYLPLHETLETECNPDTLETPIFMAHGMFDDVIPKAAATASRDFLTVRGYRVDWHE